MVGGAPAGICCELARAIAVTQMSGLNQTASLRWHRLAVDWGNTEKAPPRVLLHTWKLPGRLAQVLQRAWVNAALQIPYGGTAASELETAAVPGVTRTRPRQASGLAKRNTGIEVGPATLNATVTSAFTRTNVAPKRVFTRDPSYTLNQTGAEPRAGHLAGALWKTLTTPQDEPS